MRFIVVHKLIVPLLTLLLVGCSFNGPDWSPETAALHELRANPRVELVEVVATRPWERGHVVLYRGMMQTGLGPGDRELVFGYEILERDGIDWRFVSGGSGSAGNVGPAGQRVSYSTGSGTGAEHGSFTIVSGEVLAPEVEAVEVVFDDGERLRDDTANDVFAFVVTRLVTPCAILLFDGENQLLEQIGSETCGK